MIGDDGMGNQIGMAPGAKWIGCRNMDHNVGTPARYIECMEWSLAPCRIGGGDCDPTKAPDITNNSWGCPSSEGCSPDTLQAAAEAQAAAGIMMVVAAGNEGPSCSTVQDPPGIYEASYSVGALITAATRLLPLAAAAQSQSTEAVGSNLISPHREQASDPLVTPAITLYRFAVLMATPHISGAMALLWSAIPSLRNQITASRAALNNAVHFIASTQCGNVGPPNNVYGWGRVDIFAAVGRRLPTPTPTPTATPTPTGTPELHAAFGWSAPLYLTTQEDCLLSAMAPRLCWRRCGFR